MIFSIPLIKALPSSNIPSLNKHLIPHAAERPFYECNRNPHLQYQSEMLGAQSSSLARLGNNFLHRKVKEPLLTDDILSVQGRINNLCLSWTNLGYIAKEMIKHQSYLDLESSSRFEWSDLCFQWLSSSLLLLEFVL